MSKEMYSPFSNGTGAMMWYEDNCDKCVKAYWPKEPGNWPSQETMKQYCSTGKECRFKFHMDISFVTGEIPLIIAKEIGHTDEKGFPAQCLHFSDKNDDGFKPPKRPKPDNTGPNQMVMPFIIEESLKQKEQLA